MKTRIFALALLLVLAVVTGNVVALNHKADTQSSGTLDSTALTQLELALSDDLGGSDVNMSVPLDDPLSSLTIKCKPPGDCAYPEDYCDCREAGGGLAECHLAHCCPP